MKKYEYPLVSVIDDSFQEYKGEWSVVTFCAFCNFKCQGCYNYDTISNKDNIIGEFKDIIIDKIKPSHTAIVFLGGEPTVWTGGLIKSLLFVRQNYPKLKTKIFTNGFDFGLINRLNEMDLVDAYSVDFKAIENCQTVIGRNDIADNLYIRVLDYTITKILECGIPIEIRTTAWDCVEQIDKLKSYISEHYPGIEHIMQEDFKYGR